MNTAQKTITFVLTYLSIAMSPTMGIVAANYFIDPDNVWLCMVPDILFYGWSIGWAFLALGLTNKFCVQRWIAGGAK